MSGDADDRALGDIMRATVTSLDGALVCMRAERDLWIETAREAVLVLEEYAALTSGAPARMKLRRANLLKRYDSMIDAHTNTSELVEEGVLGTRFTPEAKAALQAIGRHYTDVLLGKPKPK